MHERTLVKKAIVIAIVAALAACGSAEDDALDGGGALPDAGAGGMAAVSPGFDAGAAGAVGSISPVGGTGGALTSMPDASPPSPDTMPAMCQQAGASCASAACCGGSTCAGFEDLGGDFCAADCTRNRECQSGCCAPLEGGGSVCAPASYCPNADPCGRPIVRGGDGRFLGIATSSATNPDGVCNKFGPYGSSFGVDSIFNKFGTYGGEFSAMGAYNQFSTNPPRIVCENGGISFEFVTKNKTKVPSVDPDVLCQLLAQDGR